MQLYIYNTKAALLDFLIGQFCMVDMNAFFFIAETILTGNCTLYYGTCEYCKSFTCSSEHNMQFYSLHHRGVWRDLEPVPLIGCYIHMYNRLLTLHHASTLPQVMHAVSLSCLSTYGSTAWLIIWSTAPQNGM